MEYLVLIAAIVVLGFFLRTSVQRIIIFEFEKGLKYTRGRFQGVLEAGSYWLIPQVSTVRKIDIRPTFVSITGQEVLSADGITLKVSLAAKYQVIDPEVAVNQIENYQAALYLELQLTLRQIIGSAPIDELLSKRHEFGKRLLELTSPKTGALGVQLLLVEIKDV